MKKKTNNRELHIGRNNEPMIKQSGLSESFPHAIHDQILLEDVSVVPQEL